MTIEDELLDLDYFVYSSHKTATQSITRTLNHNGLKCRHCHFFKNTGLKSGEFQTYIKNYLQKNKRKLNVITVFREPMERHISSFFQGHGTRPLRLKEVENEFGTIIYRYTIEQLQKQFITELSDKSLIGFPESMHDICHELQISTSELNYDEKRQFGIYETEEIKLHILRFDVLVRNYENILSNLSGMRIEEKMSNLSGLKWYKDIYSEFKSSLTVDHNVISEVYNSKADLINLLHTNNYESILNLALIKYGRPDFS
ncbi:MAG: putative capsular polysaccharide synthesis family protein [Sinobacterium sp.]|jgi:hypothetical protein